MLPVLQEAGRPSLILLGLYVDIDIHSSSSNVTASYTLSIFTRFWGGGGFLADEEGRLWQKDFSILCYLFVNVQLAKAGLCMLRFTSPSCWWEGLRGPVTPGCMLG